MKDLYYKVMYVEDAIINKLQKQPSNKLGRDLLFIRFFRIRLKGQLEATTENWYPINVEDYISWQLTQFEQFQKKGKRNNAFKKGYGYDIDYLRLELKLNKIVDNDDWEKLKHEINSIWRYWGFHKKYIIPNSAQYRNDLDKWKV